MWGLATLKSSDAGSALGTKCLWQMRNSELYYPRHPGGAILRAPQFVHKKLRSLKLVPRVARGLVTGATGRLRVARDLSHPSVTRDAWSRRNQRCSSCPGAYRRGTQSLPIRPWGRARTRYRRSRPFAGSARFIPSLRHPRRMESKKSALFFVPRSLSTRNSVASSSSMG